MRAALLCAPVLLAAGCTTVPLGGTEASVLAVDGQQRALVASADVAGLARLAHPNLRINAPGGRVLTRKQFLANMLRGEIAAEGFERTAENVSISGNIAVVMGRETFTPALTSELGRTYGSKPLHRRYTNVYVWRDGRWMWLARHANVLPTAGVRMLPHPRDRPVVSGGATSHCLEHSGQVGCAS